MKINKILLSSMLVFTSINAEQIKIEYDKSSYLSIKSIKRITGLKDSIELDKNFKVKIDNAIKKLTKEGYFKNIYIEKNEKNKSIKFKFVEKSPIVSVVVKGYKEDIDSSEFLNFIDLHLGDFYTLQKMEAIKTTILNDLSQQGYIKSEVSIIKEKYQDNIAIEIEVKKGIIAKVTKLNFKGNKYINEEELEDSIFNKEEDYFGWLWGFNDGKFKETELSKDKERIKEAYLNKGFLDANVINVKKENINEKEISLTFDVFEGDKYKISDIIISSPIMEKELLKALDFKKLDVFNLTKYKAFLETLKNKLGDKGYAFVNIVPKIKKSDTDKTISILFEIEPGEKVFINDVIIDGNTRTLDFVIRRELYLAPGDLFNRLDMIESQEALQRSGFFENVQIFQKRVSANKIDLIVKAKETKTGTIQIGGGYGSYGGLMGTLSVTDRNIFGSGIETSLKLEKSQKTSNYAVSIMNPKLNDSDYSGNMSIYNSSIVYNDYTVDTLGFSTGLGKKISRYVSGYFGYIYNDTVYTDIASTAIIDERYVQTYKKSSLVGTLSFNNTNDYYVPNKGIISSFSMETAGLGGEAEFIKNRFVFNFYQDLTKLVNHDTVFRYKNVSNYLYDNGFLPLSERIYLGGDRSIRGYEDFSISPTKADDPNVLIGGKLSFTNTIEVSTAIMGKKLRAVAFLDYGMIGNDSVTEIQKGGYGAGIEWVSPMGPLKILYAQPLLFEEGDREANFIFSFGQKF
jgi:outer membrane protein insertion porin family